MPLAPERWFHVHHVSVSRWPGRRHALRTAAVRGGRQEKLKPGAARPDTEMPSNTREVP